MIIYGHFFSRELRKKCMDISVCLSLSLSLSLNDYVRIPVIHTAMKNNLCLTILTDVSNSNIHVQVIESDAEKIITGVARSKVVVKMLKDDASKDEQLLFFEEVAPFRSVLSR